MDIPATSHRVVKQEPDSESSSDPKGGIICRVFLAKKQYVLACQFIEKLIPQLTVLGVQVSACPFVVDDPGSPDGHKCLQEYGQSISSDNKVLLAAKPCTCLHACS